MGVIFQIDFINFSLLRGVHTFFYYFRRENVTNKKNYLNLPKKHFKRTRKKKETFLFLHRFRFQDYSQFGEQLH